jgi:hypothetical protein
MLRPILLVLLALSVGGCGGRHLPSGEGDGGARDGAVGDGLLRDGPTDGPYTSDGTAASCTADDQCVVAIRTDNCCEAAYPELSWNVDPTRCVELWSASASTSIPKPCLDRWDPQCAYVDCMPAPPPSRVARCDTGRCEFALECNGAADCTVATNPRECCPCPMVVPARLLEDDPCLVPYPNGAPPPSSCYPQACPAMPCPTCPIVAAACVAQTCESGIR